MRILLLEDDMMVGDAIKGRLERERYTISWVKRSGDAYEAVQTGDHDLMILDLGLPDGDGFDLLTDIRREGNSIPVLLLTARDTLEDRVRGLDHGADDYLVKPFEMPELLARCRALGRRRAGRSDNLLTCGSVVINLSAHSVTVDGRAVNLPPHEYKILIALSERQGRVVTKPQLEEVIYGWSEGAESNTIEVYISQLRRKLGADHIRTLRGIGYMIP